MGVKKLYQPSPECNDMHRLHGANLWCALAYRWTTSESHLQPSILSVDISHGLITFVQALIVAPTCHLVLQLGVPQCERLVLLCQRPERTKTSLARQSRVYGGTAQALHIHRICYSYKF